MYEIIDKIFSEVKREMARAKVIAFGIPVNESVFSTNFPIAYELWIYRDVSI